MTRMLLLVAVVAACGDAVTVATHIEATSGSRMKLQLYRFEDGTEQVDPSTSYDTRLHAYCRAAPWIDGEQRCVPDVPDAVFADDACSTAIGFWPVMEKRPPTHFLGYELVDDTPVNAHLYPAGARLASADSYYLRDGAGCSGPFAAPPDVITFATGAELPAQSLQQVFDSELGAGRLGLLQQTTTDGLRVTKAVSDRELGVTCTPALRGDTVACEPDDAMPANVFADTACTIPAAIVSAGTTRPAYLRGVDSGGCATISEPGNEVTSGYRWDGSRCVRVSLGQGDHVLTLGPPIALATLDRTIESVRGHRLQREILESVDDPTLRFVADTLVDQATRAQCHRAQLGDTTRCLPAQLPQARQLFNTGCVVPVRVVEQPVGACATAAFAGGFADDGTETIHAIGDAVSMPLYQFTSAGCVAYVSPPGNELHTLGPALSPDAFPAAVTFGAR